MSTPNPAAPRVHVLAIGSGDSLVGGHCVGFIVAECDGDLGRVFAVKRNRGDAYRFAESVTADTPAIADPIGEAFAVFLASRAG